MCNCTFCSPKHELSRGHTAWKVSKCRICSGPYFPVFELNTEINGVNLHIESEYRKMRTRKTPYLDTFYAVLLAYWQLKGRNSYESCFQRNYFRNFAQMFAIETNRKNKFQGFFLVGNNRKNEFYKKIYFC